jgi:hypothetical protein
LWEIPLSPYDGSCQFGPPRAYSFGTHIFTVEVRDRDGRRSWAEVKIDAQIAESFSGALDIRPGNCQNILNARSRGRLTVVLAGTPEHDGLDGFDVSTVDVSTVVLEGVTPLSVRVADVVTAAEPNYCACLDTKPDGRPDLVMVFETQAVVAGLLPAPRANSRRLIWCMGEMNHPEWGRYWFRTGDCVDIVGLPDHGAGCPPAGERPASKDEGATVSVSE